MATPMKRACLIEIVQFDSGLIIVPDKTLCLLCCADRRDKQYRRNLVLDKNGVRCAGYELATFHYSLDFALVEDNYGSYVCEVCARIVRRIRKNEEEIRIDRESISRNCQKVTVSEVSKSSTETLTSGSNNFPVASQVPQPDGSSQGQGVRQRYDFVAIAVESLGPINEDGSIFLREIDIDSTSVIVDDQSDKDVHIMKKKTTHEIITATRDKRTVVLKFRSTATLKKFYPICQVLKNGSIRKALKFCIRKSDARTLGDCLTGIIHKELKEIACCESTDELFLGNKVLDLRKVDLEVLIDESSKRAPVIWSVLKAAGGSVKRGAENSKKLFAAFSLILNIYSSRLNTLQYMLALDMYDNCLAKEGYRILNAYGITVSYQSLITKLAEIETKEEATAKSCNETIEEQVSLLDHDYSGPCATRASNKTLHAAAVSGTARI